MPERARRIAQDEAEAAYATAEQAVGIIKASGSFYEAEQYNMTALEMREAAADAAGLLVATAQAYNLLLTFIRTQGMSGKFEEFLEGFNKTQEGTNR